MSVMGGGTRVRLETREQAKSRNMTRSLSGGGQFLAALAVGVGIVIPFLGIGGQRVYSQWSEKERVRAKEAERRGAHDRLVAAAPGAMLEVGRAAHGRDLFVSACSACHKADGTGVPGLGKDLTKSWFVASLDDSELVQFVETGRAANDPENTTKVAMLPKGGREDLTSEDVRSIVYFVRGLQDPRRMPKLPEASAPVVAAVTEDDKAKALAAAGGDAELAEYIAHGSKVYASTCIACHGKDGVGIPGNGKALAKSEFVKSLDDDALLAFIKRGRDPGDPKNTTGVGMPAKGGNPALTDDDLLDVIAYVRTLQGTNKP
jgi:disulfide bond formation protein DsbB